MIQTTVDTYRIDVVPERCPFCGKCYTSTFHYGHLPMPWVVECLHCCARGPCADTEKGAVEAWNVRV